MKAAFYTLGCKVNQYETQAMAEALEHRGYEIVDSAQAADAYIVNSCTVTAESDRKTRQAVRRLKRNRPDALVILCGCMPQAFPEAAQALEQADIILGNREKTRLPDIIEQYYNHNGRLISISPQEEREINDSAQDGAGPCDTITGFRERTRAIVKIEDGCERCCAYCVIPYARGPVRSKPLDALRAECTGLAQAGFREIVLVGINLSAYGTDNHASLCDAAEIAAAFPEIQRVRLGSLEPDLLPEALLDRLAGIPKLCPQFHISLQSGCDSTLKRMNRHYSAADYRDLCVYIRQSFPDAALTTDIMAGFPGETPAEFEASLAFMQEIGFEKVHVFPYSKRAGTRAAELPDQVEKKEKERRCRILAEAAQEIRERWLRAQVGRTLSILPETFHADGTAFGYTANYTPVRICGDLPGEGIVDVTIAAVDGDCCVGKAV